MNHLHGLKKQLQERKDRFHRVRYDDFPGDVGLFLDYLRSNSYTAALLELIDTDGTCMRC